MDYHGFGYIVDSCPLNETEQAAASRRLKCGVDEYRNSQYVCAPNARRTAIVEYCYRSTVGLQSPGTCLKVFSDGSYDAVSCTNFMKGCTTDYFSSADLYKYPACHQINTKDRCYYEEPACPNINMDTTVSSNETFTSIPKGWSNSSDTTIQPDDNVLKAVITGSFAGVLVLAFLLVLVYILRWRKRNIYGKNREIEEDELVSFVNPDSDVECRTTPTDELDSFFYPDSDVESRTTSTDELDSFFYPDSDVESRTTSTDELDSFVNPDSDVECRTTPTDELDSFFNPDSDVQCRTTPTDELDSFVNPDSDVQCRTTPTAIKSTCVDDESNTDDAKVCFGSSIEIEDVLKTIDDIVPELSDESIANQLVIALDYNGFKKFLQKCQKEVSFVNSETPSEEAKICVSEVTVKPSKDGLVVVPKSKVDQFHRQLRGLPRAFLVFSESVSMIEAKLAVYRKFKYNIDDNGIRIHHIFDEPEDVLNHCGHFTIDSFQKIVERLKNSVPVAEVKHIVTQAADHAFSHESIQNIFRKLFLTDNANDSIGTDGTGSYDYRFQITVSRVKENLVEKTLHEIARSFCDKIFQDIFEHVRSRLQQNTEADLHRIKFSIPDEAFIKYSAHIAVATVVVEMLLPTHVVERRAAFENFDTCLWSVNSNSLEFRGKVCDEIYNQVREKKEIIVADVTRRIDKICEKTIEELRSTFKGLDGAKKHVCTLTQKQIAEEWMLRDIRIEGMENQPTILRLISGRVDNHIKIKVFLSSCNDEIADFVEKNLKSAPKGAKLVFVEASLENNPPKLNKEEARAHSKDKGKRKELYSIVQKEEEKLFAKHSNIIAIGTSLTRQVDQEFIYDPCIVIYCLDKELIPFGEKKLPDKLNGVPCDIREDFLHLGMRTCTGNSHEIVHGCCIGSKQNGQMGSVGFLAHENTNYKSGFLTAAHVALGPTILGDLLDMRSTEMPSLSENGPIDIIHLIERDGSILSEKIGEVTKYFYGNHKQVGIDAAFVKFTDEQEELLYKRNKAWNEDHQHFSYPIESKVVRREVVDVYGNLKVYKRGMATGVTEGKLNGETSVSVPHPLCEKAFIVFKNCFQIEFSNDDKDIIFDKGDSGSGVFLLVEDTRLQPLAIAFALLKEGVVAASPLENILSTLDVSI